MISVDHQLEVLLQVLPYLSQSSLVEVVFEMVLSTLGTRHEFHETRLYSGLLQRRPNRRRLPLRQPRLQQRREELQTDPFFDEMLLKDGAKNSGGHQTLEYSGEGWRRKRKTRKRKRRKEEETVGLGECG